MWIYFCSTLITFLFEGVAYLEVLLVGATVHFVSGEFFAKR